MTNAQQALKRLTAANPVPESTSSFPAAGLSPAALLERIEERNALMAKTPTLIRPTEPVRPPKRGRGPFIALATAAAVILIGVVFAVVSPGGGAGPPATTPAPTSTLVPPTTAAPPTTEAAPASSTTTTVAPIADLDTALAYMAAFMSLDEAELESIDWVSVRPQVELVSTQAFMRGVGAEFTSEPRCSVFAQSVSCEVDAVDGFSPYLNISYTDVHTIQFAPDGRIRFVNIEIDTPPALEAFFEWMDQNGPALSAEGGPCANTSPPDVCGAAFLEAVADYPGAESDS